MEIDPGKYFSLIILITAIKLTNCVLHSNGRVEPTLYPNYNSPTVTLTSRYANSSIKNNKTIYYLTKEEKGVVLTCRSEVPNRWVWQTVDEIMKMVEVEKERKEDNKTIIYSSKIIIHFGEIDNPTQFNLSCMNEIEYNAGSSYPVTCVTVNQILLDETNSLGPIILSVLQIDSLENCSLKSTHSNCSIKLVVNKMNLTGICKPNREPTTRRCNNLDHCNSLIYLHAENKTCEATFQSFNNSTSEKEKALINIDHCPYPQIATCRVIYEEYGQWSSFLLLYSSFGKSASEKFDYYATMQEALEQNSIHLFALSEDDMERNQTTTLTVGRREFADNETVEFLCRAVLFLYMQGFRLRLGTGNSTGTVVEGFKGNNTIINKDKNYYTFSQNIALSTVKYGRISWISCDGPIWNSPKWFTSTMNISIYPSEKPYVELNCTDNGNLTTFICTYRGWPRPSVSWTFSEPVKFNNKSRPGYEPNVESYNTTWSQVKEIINSKTSFNVTCAVTNFVGSSSQSKLIKGSMSITSNEGNVVQTKVVYIIIGCSTVGFLILAAVFVSLYRRKYHGHPKQQLTEAEITEFYNGETGTVSSTNYEALELPYNNDYEIKENELTTDGSILGSGQFGIVLKGKIGPLTVAVKTVKPTADIIYLKSLLSELKILQYVGAHPNIVNLIGANTANIKKREVLLVLDYCSNGSLLSFLRQSRERFVNFFGNSGSQVDDERKQWPLYENSGGITITTLNLLAFAYEVASGMEHLARKNVIHGDLAARNVLITGDLHAKVCDFGLAKQLLHYSVYVQKVDCPLPLRWMAIESLQDMEFSLQSDRWSFGICLWEIFSLAEIPYPGEQWSFDSYKMLQEAYRMAKPTYANDSIYQLMLQCWDAQPQLRPSFQHISNEIKKEEDSLT